MSITLRTGLKGSWTKTITAVRWAVGGLRACRGHNADSIAWLTSSRLADIVNLYQLVYCHVLNAHIRASQMVHSQAQLAGNGEYPCQELQRRCGPFVGLPSGEALSGHLRCCIGLT